MLALVVVLGVLWGQDERWPGMKFGPHHVGFQSFFEQDQARTYHADLPGGVSYHGPRPILINLWYPAAMAEEPEMDAMMLYQRYLDLTSMDESLAPFAAAIAEYATDISANELLDQAPDQLAPNDSDAWLRHLQSPTRCIEDAEPQSGSFPVVIYHAGAASSYEDNAQLCEYLASHGYVVLGSAFQEGNGQSLAIDGGEDSIKDLEFLAQYAATLPFADTKVVGFVGHSAGAQACLRALAKTTCPATAAVLLDTTLDYYCLAVPTFGNVVNEVLTHAERITAPLLVAAGEGALFALCDRLSYCDRDYLTVPALDHNEYISQGVQRLQLAIWRERATADDSARRWQEILHRYVDLCETTRSFLDAKLKGHDAPWQSRVGKLSLNKLGTGNPSLQQVPIGIKGASPYDPSLGVAPAPRQLLPYLATAKIQDFCAMWQHHHARQPDHPVFSSTMVAGSLLYELANRDEIAAARTLHQCLQSTNLDGINTIRFLAWMCELTGRMSEATQMLELALKIDPADSETRAKWDALQAKLREASNKESNGH